MTENLGPGVSRVLVSDQASYNLVIWQAGKPPTDAELNLSQRVASDWNRIHVLRGTPSGWYGDAVNPQDSYVTDPKNSNWFKLGPQFSGEKQAIQWACVNGWLVPVTGTLTGNPPGSPNNSDTWNRITLPPAPANTGDARIDFVFLEAWLARVPPNPATTNKPSASAIWRHGNVEGGMSFLADDLQDPALGFETTQRVQLQYRIRVVSGLVGLAGYPDGFDPSVVKGQGGAVAITSFVFQNMRQELGDPGLWRAGDGTANTLGSVDGYTYAIPLLAVFRRNRVQWSSSNLNGSFDRNPTAVDRTGYRTFSTVPALSVDMTSSATSLTLASATTIPLPATPASPVTIQIGDEYLTYTSITGVNVSGLTRGAFGSKAEIHKSGSIVTVVSGRPDGMFADQIAKVDILDLRHTVNPGGFDYQALLKGNFDRLLRGQLRSTWKRSGGGPQGPWVQYMDLISASSGPLGVTKLLDSPDGIRTIWGDPAALQPVVIPLNTPLGVTGPAVSCGATLGNSFSSVTINRMSGSGFLAGNIITVPKSIFTISLPGSDADQVRLIPDQTYVKIRFMGEITDLPLNQYSLSNNGGGDLLITLTGPFVTRNFGAFLTLHVQYGAGRGLSRRPEVVHSVNYISASPRIALQPQAVPASSTPLRASLFPLWSQFQNQNLNGATPSTAEAHVDPGSKSVALTPFKLIPLTLGTESQFKTIQMPDDAQTGAMPTRDLNNVAKWSTSDPLSLFSNHLDPTTAARNMVIVLPRAIMPGFGEVRAPILYQDNGNVNQGVNFGIYAPKGTVGTSVSTYVPMVNGSVTYAIFSTQNLNTLTPATYNAPFSFGTTFAGMRFFTDTTGLNRQGLELPPFYGVSRLFAVYSANDYKLNSSAFNPTTRQPNPPGAQATNLLRQNYAGPVLFITRDQDGDSTFVLNADAIDIKKGPDVIASFGAGNYVIETSIFGFDRGCFDLTQDARIVLTRDRSEGLTSDSTITSPQFILPGAPELGDQLSVVYSRSPYQGDPFNSQYAATDTGYKPGALSTASRYQLLTTVLDYPNLTKPNPKTLEIVCSLGFVTTLGTGRFSGNVPVTNNDTRSISYEPWTIPATSGDARPTLTPVALAATERTISLGTELSGATCHLPLGSLFLDKDFRGNAIGGPTGDLRQLAIGDYSPGFQGTSLAPVDNPEYDMAPVHGSSVASDQGVVVHTDGNSDSYNVLLNYRTCRGGAAFTAHELSGGDVGALLPDSKAATTSGGVLSGIAMLVRNVPTNIGANEVSAGQELMMLVCTTARPQGSSGTVNAVQVSTSGTGEGYSAADLYRLSGHPLANDPARPTLDPLAIRLARKSSLL